MNKLKNKLAVFVMAYAVIIFALFIVFNHFYIERKNRTNALETELYSLENGILESFNDINTLLLKTFNDSDIVFTDQNMQLLQLQKKIPRLNVSFEQLNKNLKILPGDPVPNIAGIIEYYQHYIAYLNEIIALLKQRGETNTGILARINHIESQLCNEVYFDKSSLDELQNLSRCYLLYKKQDYVDQINRLTNSMESGMQRKNISSREKTRLASMLSNYTGLFDQLVKIDLNLDFKTPVSYTSQLIEQKNKITKQFDVAFESVSNSKASLSRNGVIYYAALFVLIILSALLLGMAVARLISRPVEWLTGNIIKILYNKQDISETQHKFGAFAELEDLYKKILVLLQYLKDQEDKRQIAQKELRQSEKRFRELTDMLPQSIYETDSLGNLTYVNRAWRKTFGFETRDVEKGVNVIETIVSESGEGVMGNRKFVHSDFIGVRKDGTTFPAIVYSNQVVKNSKMNGIRGIVIDNTERMKYIQLLKKEKEKAVELDKQKTNYLADMSHELRTPMNAIVGFADLLASLELNENQKEEFVAHINHSSQHILSLIDDIIDLAKIESGELKINKEHTSVNELLTEQYLSFEEIIKRSGKNEVYLVLNAPLEKLYARTDPNRFKQVIDNLLGNALKYTDSGKIELGYEMMGKNMARFYVSDNGKGIKAENLDMIFDRYKQIDKGDIYKGKGLGLAISKKIVELLGGKIWVESEINKGTTFYFTLPATISGEINKPGISDFVTEYDWADKLILVAEDEDLNFRVVKEFISKTGAKVMRAYDGEEVVDICKNNPKIDLVLMDIKMPRKNGFIATREIKGFNSELPVIALTAYALTNEKEKCIEVGCDDYIAKPFKKDYLLHKLNSHLTKTFKVQD